MKKISDKEFLMCADLAGFPLKETVRAHLQNKVWKITYVGMAAMGGRRNSPAFSGGGYAIAEETP